MDEQELQPKEEDVVEGAELQSKEEEAVEEPEMQPEEQEEATPTVLSEAVPSAPKRLLRSRRDRVIFGVCGGVGQYFGVDPVIVRALWVFFALITFGAGAVFYLLAMLVMPEAKGEEPNAVRRLSVESNIFWGALLVLAGLYFLVTTLLSHIVPEWVWGSIRAVAIATVLVGAGLLVIFRIPRREEGERRRLTRSRKDRMIAGVCGGLGRYFKVDPTWVRLIWIVFSLFAVGSMLLSIGIGAAVYLAAMLAIPEE